MYIIRHQKDNPIIIENLNQSNEDDNRMDSKIMDETAFCDWAMAQNQ